MTSSPRCKARVWGNSAWPRERPCSKPALPGKDFCGTHDPEAVARRDEKKAERITKAVRMARRKSTEWAIGFAVLQKLARIDPTVWDEVDRGVADPIKFLDRVKRLPDPD